MNSKRYKFIDNSKNDLKKDTPGFWNYENKSVDTESFLLLPKKRTPISTGQIQEPINTSDSILGSNFSAGRGFGNLDVSNDIRFGENSRSNLDDFKKKREGMIVDRFEYLNKNFQDPQNIILPFPRGGEITRSKVNIQNVKRNNKNDTDNFNFKY